MRIYNFEAASKKSTKHFKRFHRGLKNIFSNKRLLVTWFFRLFAIGVTVMAALFVYLSFTLPDPNTLLERTVPESTKIYDRNNQLLYEVHGEVKRTLVQLDAISDYAKHATVAVEDKDFYSHSGFSIRGIFRSIWKDIKTGSAQQGGSTITQQFVKNALLTKEKHLIRKVKELILSVELEARYTKDQILQLYLNEIPYGRNAYGIEAASQAYFGKHANELSLGEAAYLAALPQSTTYYNPLGPHRDALDRRQQTILGLMEAQGYITKDQKEAALQEKVAFTPLQNNLKAPHFVLYVQDYLAKKYGELSLEQGGLKVYTTLDLKLQDIAENVVKEQADKNEKESKAYNAGFVAIDPKTGQILAMVGSRDFFGKSAPAGCNPGKDCLFDPSVNVTLTPQQPGSSFKPYVYLTAFKEGQGYAPASLLMDVKTNFGRNGDSDYVPQNYNGQFNGPVSIRKALAGSLNIPAVKMLALVGVDNATQTARDLGITSPLKNCGLSLVLGGCEVTLLDHTAGYATLANGGIKNPVTPILKVEDKSGNTLEEFTQKSSRVVDAQAVYELTSIMTDNNARSYIFGVNNYLTLPDRQLACKTGTTNRWRDGWSMCYTPSIAVGAWVGNSNNKEMKAATADGSRVAAPITNKFLKQALQGTPAEQFAVPDGISKVVVDSVSGKLPTEFSPETKEEVFASYSVPKEYDDVHIGVKIDRTSGLPANNLTPPENIDLHTYTVFHSERPDNAAWETPVREWMLAKQMPLPPEGSIITNPTPTPNTGEDPKASIISPAEGAVITQSIFTVQVEASSPAGITRIDLLIDGQLVESKTAAPYNFMVGRQLTDGPKTIAIHLIDKNGKTADQSVPVIFAVNAPITLVKPNPNSTQTGHVAIAAVSGQDLGTISFYANAILIATAEGLQNPDGSYTYSTDWIPTTNGTYKLQAKANSTSSEKISILYKK